MGNPGLTRIAPTPSGWLHVGNLCSFLLTRLWADFHGIQVILRIDDLDRDRTKDIYIDDILQQLEWAGIRWEFGAFSLENHHRHFSQSSRFNDFLEKLQVVRQLFPQYFFVCACSRKDKEAGASCRCREQSIELQAGQNALFFDLEPFINRPLTVLNEEGVQQNFRFGFEENEIPLIRREGFPAYHWVSLCEDRHWKVSHIVRGRDLWECTLLQNLLETLLFPDEPIFSRAKFLHHELLRGPGGEKLSKSEKSQSVLELRANGFSREHLYRVFSDFMGIDFGEKLEFSALRDEVFSRWSKNQ